MVLFGVNNQAPSKHLFGIRYSSFALSKAKQFFSSRLTIVSNDNTIQELLIVSKQWETQTTYIHHPQ